MKKIYSYVIAAAAMLAAASCQEIVEPAVKGPEAFSLTAVAGVDTKTTLVDGVKTYWMPTDRTRSSSQTSLDLQLLQYSRQRLSLCLRI